MNPRQMKENLRDVVEEMARLKGQDMNLAVSHPVSAPDTALVYYQLKDKKDTNVRFIFVKKAPKGKEWILGFCQGLSTPQSMQRFVGVKGDTIVKESAQIMLEYLDNGEYPQVLKDYMKVQEALEKQ